MPTPPGGEGAATKSVTKTANRDSRTGSGRPSPWPLAFVAGLLGLLANLVATHAVRPYNSDDTALQTILGQWARGYHNVAHLGPDTFVPKLPLYLLIRSLIDNGRPALLATAVILNLAGFALFVVSVRYFARKFGAQRPGSFIGPLLWVASLGIPLTSFLINPNVRNVEIGAAFFFLMLVSKYRDGELAISPVWLVLAAPVLGLFLYDDPYFLFLFVVPLGALLVASLVVGPFNRRSAEVILLLVGGTVAYKVIERAFTVFGLDAEEPGTSFSRPDQIDNHLGLLARGSLRIFDADLFSNYSPGPRSLHSLLNLALLLCIVLYPLVLVRLRVGFRDDPWKWFFGLYPLFIAAVFVVSGQAVDIYSARYLVLIPFLAVFVLGVVIEAVHKQQARRLIVLVLVGASVANLASTYRSYRRDSGEPNAHNYAVARAAMNNGMTKGYADFWSANINTYLSKERVDFIPVKCVQSRSQLHLWLMDDAILGKPASQSFFLWERDNPTGCSYDDLTRQFGLPVRLVDVDDSRRLMLYDYDLVERISRP